MGRDPGPRLEARHEMRSGRGLRRGREVTGRSCSGKEWITKEMSVEFRLKVGF